jgi:hypothetical protein
VTRSRRSGRLATAHGGCGYGTPFNRHSSADHCDSDTQRGHQMRHATDIPPGTILSSFRSATERVSHPHVLLAFLRGGR